jgi:hypothetical protein
MAFAVCVFVFLLVVCPRRLLRLSPLLPHPVCCGTCACGCRVPGARSKATGERATRVNTEGDVCPDQPCAYLGITDSHLHASCWRWQAWACRAHPDVWRPCLPSHVHFQAHHCPVPSENPFSPDRRRALCKGRRAGPFGCPTGLRLWTSPQHQPFSLAQASRHRPCTNAASVICGSRICSWMNCEPGCAALNTCSGSGWPSTPVRSFFPSSLWVGAHNTWHMSSSTLSERAWPPFCLPLLTSDGLILSFSAACGSEVSRPHQHLAQPTSKDL